MYKVDVAHRGMALVAVLWFVAALSIVVGGIVTTVRRDVQLVGIQRHLSVAAASADGLVVLALQKLHLGSTNFGELDGKLIVNYEGNSVTVSVRPLNSLIDINNAALPLLADLYQYAGQLAVEEARTLAQSTLDTRAKKNKRGVEAGFDSEEDLFRVPGFTYGLYAKIKDAVTADIVNGSGRVNPKFAPTGVLLVLANGDVDKVNLIEQQRRDNPKFVDFSALDPSFIDMSFSTALILEVFTYLPNGDAVRRRQWVSMREDPRTGIPWRVLRKNLVVMSSLGTTH